MRRVTGFTKPSFQIASACAAVLLVFSVQYAEANPIGGSVVGGQASFNTLGNTVTVTNTPGTIINWQGFSIGTNETTRFSQQSASSAVLNRVITNNPSSILGSLQSNGRVFLVNPNGIVFGQGSTVDVAGMVATTLRLSDADFLAGRHNYSAVPGAQNISNAGNISAHSGGQIYLIAPNVDNSGVISAPNGEILLAAGNSVELVNSLDPNLRVNITAPAGNATNVGQLVASAGSLGLFGTVVKNTGTVNADSATLQGGKIVFKASQLAQVGGTVSVTGTTGGTIQVLGNDVQVTGGALLDASGVNGGGTVLIGGDAHGTNSNVLNAQTTYVDAAANIKVDAAQNGNGGKVVVWSDKATQFGGNISARGGAVSGNGGWVEVSGKQWLGYAGLVDTTAAHGAIGSLLLDPADITISTATSTGTMFWNGTTFTFSDIATGGVNASTLNVNTLITQLGLTNVTVSSASTGTAAGNITVADSIVWNSANSLTLNAAGTGAITVNALTSAITPLTITNNGTGGLNMATAGGSITVGGAITLGGGIFSSYAAGAGTTTINAALNTGAGTVSIYSGGAITASGNITSGLLSATGGGLSLSGTNSLGSLNATSLSVTGGTTNVSGAVTSSVVNISAGTLNLNSPTTLTTFNLSGGTLGGIGAITMSGYPGAAGTFNWTGGTLTGTGAFGTTATSIGPGTTTTMNGTLTLDKAFTNNGTMTQGVGTLALTVTSAGSLTNSATGTLTLGNATNGGSIIVNGTFLNAGALSTSGTGVSFVDATGATVGTITNTGTVAVVAGTAINAGSTLNWTAGQTATSTGAWTIGSSVNPTFGGVLNLGEAAGAPGGTTQTYSGAFLNYGNVNVNSGTNTLSGAFTNNNTLQFTTGTNSLSGSYTEAGTTQVTFTSGTNTITAVPQAGGPLSLFSLSVNGGVNNLNTTTGTTITGGLVMSGGTLTGSSNITLSTGGIFNWIGGSLATTGAASLTLSASTTTTLGQTASILNLNRALTNSGTVSVQSVNRGWAATLNIGAGGSFTNNGTFNVGNALTGFADNTLTVNVSDTGAFINGATGIVNSAGSTNAIQATLATTVGTITNSGTINVAAGSTLNYVNGLTATNTGTFTTAAATTTPTILNFSASTSAPAAQTYTFNAITNNGTVNTTVSSGTWNFNSATSLNTLTLSTGGSLNAGGITIPSGGVFNWSGGVLYGTGMTLSAGATGNLTGTLAVNGLFTNAGTLSQGTTAMTLNVGTGGNFTNNGIFNLGNSLNAGLVNVNDTGAFTNGATGVINSAGSVTNIIQGVLGTVSNIGAINNSGTINVAAGNTLSYLSGLTTAANSGTFANSGVLNLGPSPSAAPGAVFTYGTLANSGTLNLSGTGLTLAMLIQGAGTVNNNSPGLVVNNYVQSGGTLNTGGTTLLKSPGSMTINGMIVSGGGSLTLQAVINIVLGVGSTINAGTGVVTLASTTTAGNFINNSGSTTPITASGVQIWTTSPAITVKSGMVPAYSYFGCTYLGTGCTPSSTGIGFLYSQPAPLLTVTASTQSKVYGTLDPTLTYTASGLVGGDIVASVLSGALTRAPGNNVGSYLITQGTVAAVAGYGYTISYIGANLSITPATLTYTANAASRLYGAANPAFSGTVTGFMLTDTLATATTGTAVFTTGALTTSNVGSYAITGSGLTPNGNYTIANAAGNNTAFTITPAMLTYTANAASRLYGAANPAFSGTVTGFVLTDTLATATTGTAVFTTGASSTSNVGSYVITGSGLTPNSNYTIVNAAGNNTFTITPAALTVSANALSKVYGTVDPALTYVASGLIGTDVLTGSLSRVAGETVAGGPYAINQGTLANSNYAITYTGNNLSITPAALAVSANALSKVYGTVDPALAYVASGLIGTDVLTGSLSRVAGETVAGGPYAINQGTLANSNYAIAYTSKSLTITPALLTVSADVLSKVLGTPDPFLTYTVSGLKLTDTASGTLGGALARAPGNTIGSYMVNQGTVALLSKNYTMNYVPCDFTILAPTVVQEITHISLLTGSQNQTSATTSEEDKKKAENVAATTETKTEGGSTAAELLPVCR